MLTDSLRLNDSYLTYALVPLKIKRAVRANESHIDIYSTFSN